MKYLLSLFILLSIIINPLSTFASEVVLAGGCFWCLEHDLESLNGVISVESGYSGGNLKNPTYENHDGHQEAVLVNYDSGILKFPTILRLYFRNIDPLDGGGQFCDRGNSYKPVIFFGDLDERNQSEEAMVLASKELKVSRDRIKVELKPKGRFWMAEDYHQDFANRNELKYKFYRFSCGRDQKLDKLWGANARSRNIWANN